MPATSKTVARYLTDIQADYKVGSLQRRFAALNSVHRAAGHNVSVNGAVIPLVSWVLSCFIKSQVGKLRRCNMDIVARCSSQTGQVDSLAIHPTLYNPDFLYEYGMIPALIKNTIMGKVKQGKTTYEFKISLYGNHMIEIIRYKKKKRIPYRASSQVLEEILELRMKDQWWIQF